MKRLYLWQDLLGNQQVIVANSFRQARHTLLIQQKAFFKLTLKGYLTKRSFSLQHLVDITKQLATMLKAGLPIIETLTIIANNHPILQWQWLLNEIKQQLIQGNSISQTLKLYPDIFPTLYQEIIATGELTGQLENSFERLAEQLENTLTLRNKIKKAIRYPIFLLMMTMLVSLIMLLVVLPNFIDVYHNFDAQLPAFTQFVIAISKYLQDYIWVIVAYNIAIIIIYQKYIKIRYQKTIEQKIVKLPFIGKLVTSANLTQIFQTLSVTQQAGIPLLTGIITAQKTTYHQLFQEALLNIKTTIEQGRSFSHAIRKTHIFPQFCFQLIMIGEESGTLDIMLTRLANYYQYHNDQLIESFTSKLEPLMMSIMAIIIGCLVIAMYLPIFQLGSVIH